MGTVLVVGSGIAGLVAALKLSATHEVTIVTKDRLAESNTLYAQGGIAAVMPGHGDDSADVDSTEVDSTEVDSTEAHILDTLRAGAGLNDYSAVETLCTDGPGLIRELIELGVAFDQSGGTLARGREAAHSSARILHAGGDATGAAIEHALVAAVRASSCYIVENAFLADLIVDNDRVVGADIAVSDAQRTRCDADVVILATGGAGQLFRHTTNPSVTTGDGIAAAWRAGAELTDIEFFQFHPTALAVPGSFLISEAVRGEGATLINATGQRFMLGVHPDAELAPRDVVARAIAVEMAAQNGVPVRLDATHLGTEFLARRFPTIDAATRAAGFDWGNEPIPVTPAAHYWMGGIATDLWGRASLPGLYAIGEAACTGVHGANRLASNSLLEGLVFADRAVRDISRLDTTALLAPERAPASVPSGRQQAASSGRRSKPGEFVSGASSLASPSPDRLRSSVDKQAGPTVDRAELQELMWDTAGVLRSRDSLELAAEKLHAWSAADPSNATVAEREDANLLDIARALVDAALAREESRGAHYRSDFPHSSPDLCEHLRWSRGRRAIEKQGAIAC